MTVYFDNAATTPLIPEVWEAMTPYLKEHFGNPSSTHSFGRKAKNAFETSRREIAKALGVLPGQIIFTGSGTEGNNTILQSALALGVNHIISSPIEHHAVLHTLDYLKANNNIKVSLVDLDNNGNVILDSLIDILKKHSGDKKMVSLMHVNNEIGTILPVNKVGEICKAHDTLFHSDTVQSMGTIPFDLKESQLDFATCSAHKFHGPKGVGFMYVKDTSTLSTYIHGGGQERGHRAGTENVSGVIGMSTALCLSIENINQNLAHLKSLRNYFIEQVTELNSEIKVVGNTDNNASPKILNLCFPLSMADDMFLFNLDIRGVAASGGSACSSGSNQGSHVIAQLTALKDCRAIRFSFSKLNTKQEIDFVIEQIKKISNA
jgi:cysteine desulfurase